MPDGAQLSWRWLNVGRDAIKFNYKLQDLPAEAHGSTKEHMAAQRGLSPPGPGGGGVTGQTPMKCAAGVATWDRSRHIRKCCALESVENQLTALNKGFGSEIQLPTGFSCRN